MQSLLTMLLRIFNPLLQDPLGLLDELPMQINRIRSDPLGVIVLTEDEIRRLPVVRVHLGGVLLALLGQLVRSRAIAALVCLARLFVC